VGHRDAQAGHRDTQLGTRKAERRDIHPRTDKRDSGTVERLGGTPEVGQAGMSGTPQVRHRDTEAGRRDTLMEQWDGTPEQGST
jgi:hypothetical protein